MGTCVGAGLIAPSDEVELTITCGSGGKGICGRAWLGLTGPVIFCMATSIKLAILSRSFCKIVLKLVIYTFKIE